jgi:HEAT repeat protein
MFEVRRQTHRYAPGVGGLRPKDVARLCALSGEALAAASICSMHPSGYVREAAVEELSKMHDGRELPYLILQTADWGPEVRRLAQKCSTMFVSGNPRLCGEGLHPLPKPSPR